MANKNAIQVGTKYILVRTDGLPVPELDKRLIEYLFKDHKPGQVAEPAPTATPGHGRLTDSPDHDYERWKRGDVCRIGEYSIEPKKDMGGFPEKHGWVVCANGCNILPGATWGKSMDQATYLQNCIIAAGGSTENMFSGKAEDREASAKMAARFWALVHAFQYIEGKK